ncbi:MAG: hypothetical protein E6767_19565 [Dysgonomonas sp.]|nr:hypothetical protein [Dysgonomonas sp.]
MKLFSLGKEAAYRRLRGDVPFTFTEACIISEELGLSLDVIVNMQIKGHKVLYELTTPPEKMNTIKEYKEFYYNTLYNEHHSLFEKYKDKTSLNIISACNIIPQSLLLPYIYLLHFRAFKWIYQLYTGPFPYTCSDIKINEEMIHKLKEISSKISDISNMTFILGRNIITTFIKQILHFRRLRMIPDEYFVKIKDDLLSFVSDLEQTALLGKNRARRQVWIFLSNIDFESNYTHISHEGGEHSFMQVYQIHSLSSLDPSANKITKEWVESLRKYATLISLSGEMERIAFFEEQKRNINNLLKIE